MEIEYIYKKYFHDIFLYIRSMSGDTHLAEEITQETFVKAMKQIGQLDEHDHVRAWLYSIARNTFYRHCRRKRIYSDEEIRELQQFRKYLSGRTLRAVLLSVLCAAVILVGSAVYMNHQIRYISCADAGLTIMEESSEEVVLTDSVRGNYHWIYHLDTSTGISTVHFEQTLWERYVDCIFYPFDHEQVILKKDTIKEIYVDADGSQITIWEASDEEKERYFSSPRDNLG